MNRDFKPKVLIVHNYYRIPGGEDSVVENEKKLLEDHGHEVLLYSRSNKETEKFVGVKKLLLPFVVIFNFRTFRDIRKIIHEQHINIVHVHNTLALISPSIYYASLSCKVPIVQTIHNFRFLCPNGFFYRDGHICEDCAKYGLKCAIRHGCYQDSHLRTSVFAIHAYIHRKAGIYGKLHYICLTDFNKKKLLALKQIDPQRVFIKPNFAFHSQSKCTGDKSNLQEGYFIYAGRLDESKGVDLLLKAWHAMGEKAPRLLICGTGPLSNWCEKYIRNHQVRTVKMLGYVANEKTKELIARAKALILPTRWYEGFPMVIAEAYSVGTPVISSNIGNAGNLVREGITGYKITEISADSMWGAVKKIESKNLSQSVQAVFLKEYSAEANYEKLLHIYNACLKDGAVMPAIPSGL